MKTKREDVRNVAIIAHVDHGKTTLVDQLLKQSGVFRANQEVQERVMDSNDIERERGITILSKNTAVHYKDTKINIIDTPGHADFGGEVERVLKMVDGVILLVDAFEGAMPQTKFVLKKALELDLHVIVCINKIDRPEARPDEVVDEVLELLMDLGASDEQLDCPFLYASAKTGHAVLDLKDTPENMEPLFEAILKYIPAPEGDPDADTQVLISTIDYNEYVGRIGVGKVESGTIAVNQELTLLNHHDPDKKQKVKISKLYEFDGLNKVEVKEATIGSIVAISGIAEIHIGDTLCGGDNPEAIPFQKISEPTIAMNFLVNDSPLAGQEGKYITSRHLRDRLYRELNTDVSLRVEDTETTECFKVSGRGELHLSVLIENMRREGYEFAVSKPEVLYKIDERGKKLEPMEIAYIDVPEEFSGTVIQMLSERKGEPLFEAILKYIPAPEGDPDADTQVLISTIDYNEYVGRIGVGKVESGTIAVNQELTLLNHHDPDKKQKVKISKLYEFDGLNKVEVKEATIGSIVAISGIAEIHIGDTLCGGDNPEAIPFQKISEPTIAMNFLVNDSPLAGQEGKYITSRHLRDRLYRELNTDVSLRVEDTETTECFKVSGRGELHLSVLIENMRREGYEFAVSKPEVLYKIDERGKKLEPMEIAYIDVPEEFSGTVIQMLSERKGELQGMSTASDGSVRLEFHIPSRGLIGFRGNFLTSTKGTGIINTIFDGYSPYKGDFQYRKQGSLIAFEGGEAVTYGLFAAQERGTLFIGPGAKVYSGMVIGQNGKAEDIELNVCKTKHLTNTRSSSADEALKLTPPRVLSLEQAIEFIDTDELLEVTPSSLRIRKKILDSRDRKRASIKKNA